MKQTQQSTVRNNVPKVPLEDIKEKVELILEGHATLNNKIDRVEENLEEKIELLGAKIDAVASDLAAHRADTESHPKAYKVSDAK